MTGAQVRRVNGPLIEVDGLAGVAMNDQVAVADGGLLGEVVGIREGRLTVQVYEYTGGLRPGDPAVGLGRPLSARLGPGLLGGIFDGLLRPLDGAPDWLAPGRRPTGPSRSWPFLPRAPLGGQVEAGAELGTVTEGAFTHRILLPPGTAGQLEWLAPGGPLGPDDRVATVGGVDVGLSSSWPVRRPRPFRERIQASKPLVTGQRVLDTLYPLSTGGAGTVPGGFGTGKTILLQQIAKWCDADIIVYVGCGERGNELADVMGDLGELTDPRTGRRLAERTVIIANTSNMPVMAREASIYTGITVAEYFRDMGLDAVVIADSTSRWAEALREFASRSGELPAEEGYPAGLASALAAFYERAGAVATLGGDEASVTTITAVSPPGGDMTEPVTAHTERFVRTLWSLDRDLAYARHYPAVSWRGSFSRDAELVGAWHARQGDLGWAGRRARINAMLAEADRLAAVAELVGIGALPGKERVVLLAGRLLREGVLQQNALSTNDAYCAAPKQAILAEAVLRVYERATELVDQGVAAETIEGLDFARLLRAREDVGPGDVEGVAAARDSVLAALETMG